MSKKHKAKAPTWKRIIKRVNIFFLRMNRQEVLTFLVFLVIAAFFWVIESASEENDATFTVEFRVENQPDNFVFTTQVPKQLKVQVKDKNINLLAYSYNKAIDTLAVDFSRYNDALGNFRISGAELQALLINSLNPSTQITSLTPPLIDARFAITEGKRLPVVFDAEITPASNYRCHPISIYPDSVLIHAPSGILDTITMIKTEHLEVLNMTDTMNIALPLQLKVGMRSTPEKVDITVPVAMFVEKTLTNVPINIIDVPEGEELAIFPNRADISFLVDFSYFQTITQEDFYITASYNSIKSDTQQKLPLEVISYADPEIANGVRLKMTEVEYIIEHIGEKE